MKDKQLVVARYEAKGHRFEILVDPELALKVKEGKQVNVDDLTEGEFIYKDVKKGLKASPESLREVFGTDDPKVVALEIVKRGEIQLTAEQRKRFIEEKKAQIVNLIARNAIDPRTKLPIPTTRIELAMEQAKVTIDPYKPPEAQLDQIVSQISKVIPIRLAKAYVSVKIPAQYAGKIYRQVTSLGSVRKTQWLNDGSLIIELEIPAGMQQEFIDKINGWTKGSAEVKIVSVG